MPRTTLDIDASVLEELRQRRGDHRSLGQLVSELLAQALAEEPRPPAPLAWPSQPMGARLDLDDTEALMAALGDR